MHTSNPAQLVDAFIMDCTVFTCIYYYIVLIGTRTLMNITLLLLLVVATLSFDLSSRR